MSGVLLAAQRLARALEERRPRPGRAVATGLHRGAVANAHDAMEALRRTQSDRSALHPSQGGRLVPLSRRETLELLQRQSVGRFAYVARAGVPDVVPVNYVWHQGAVLIRSGPGPKLQAAQRHDTVAFEVDEVDGERRNGLSAVVVGKAEVVPPQSVGCSVDAWADGPRRHVIRIVPLRVEGRRLG